MVKAALKEIKGIGPSMVKKLYSAGIRTLEDLAAQSLEKLCQIDGVGAKTAENWISDARQLLDDDPAGTRDGSQVQKQNKQKSKSEIDNRDYSQALMDAMDGIVEKLETDIGRVFDRIVRIEQRLEAIEANSPTKTRGGKKLITTMMNHPFIRNEDTLLDILKEKIEELKSHSPSLQNMFIADIYRQIIKEYSITREIFSEYLLMLYRSGKIQLEPGRTDQGFAVRDMEGNAYKIVKIIE